MRAKSVINSIVVVFLAIAAGAGITWVIFDRSPDDLALDPGYDVGGEIGALPGAPADAARPPVKENTVAKADVATAPGNAGPGEKAIAEPEPVEDPLWDSRIRSALTRADLSLRQKSQQLLDLASGDSGEGASIDQRLEALDHGLNLVDDEDYDEDALRLALRSDLPAELGESILTDLHGRDPELLVGTCQKIAALQDHPLREEALEIVSFLAPELLEEAAN